MKQPYRIIFRTEIAGTFEHLFTEELRAKADLATAGIGHTWCRLQSSVMGAGPDLVVGGGMYNGLDDDDPHVVRPIILFGVWTKWNSTDIMLYGSEELSVPDQLQYAVAFLQAIAVFPIKYPMVLRVEDMRFNPGLRESELARVLERDADPHLLRATDLETQIADAEKELETIRLDFVRGHFSPGTLFRIREEELKSKSKPK